MVTPDRAVGPGPLRLSDGHLDMSTLSRGAGEAMTAENVAQWLLSRASDPGGVLACPEDQRREDCGAREAVSCGTVPALGRQAEDP